MYIYYKNKQFHKLIVNIVRNKSKKKRNSTVAKMFKSRLPSLKLVSQIISKRGKKTVYAPYGHNVSLIAAPFSGGQVRWVICQNLLSFLQYMNNYKPVYHKIYNYDDDIFTIAHLFNDTRNISY